MSAFNDDDKNDKKKSNTDEYEDLHSRLANLQGVDKEKLGTETELFDRLKNLTGRTPVVLEATAPAKSEEELQQGEDELAEKFKSIFGKKPMVYEEDGESSSNNNNINTTNILLNDVKNFENNNVDISNLKNNFAYDGNDDDIDLLFAETSNVDEEGIIQDAGMFLGSLNVNNNDNTNINVHNTTTTTIDDNDTTVHVIQLGGGDDVISNEAEDLMKQTKEIVDLEKKIGKNYRKKTKKPTANNNSNNIVNNVFDNMNSAFGDVDDDEVRQLILKAKQQARLDQKFGNATTTNSNDKKKMEEDEESDKSSSVSDVTSEDDDDSSNYNDDY